MKKTITRTFCLDGDICDVVFRLDETSGKYLGDYPDFELSPRYTKGGYPWMEAVSDSCEHNESAYSDAQFGDCGSCKHFLREKSGDLIGICTNDKRRKTN